jgi:hypothetical protein
MMYMTRSDGKGSDDETEIEVFPLGLPPDPRKITRGQSEHLWQRPCDRSWLKVATTSRHNLSGDDRMLGFNMRKHGISTAQTAW